MTCFSTHALCSPGPRGSFAKNTGFSNCRQVELDARESVTRFFLDCNNIEHSLDVVELIFSEVERIDTRDRSFDSQLLTPEEAVAELNQRFREHGVGYEYRNGQLIRVDSALLHHEVVIPALQFLQQSFLKGANDEFLSAHEHYRHKRYKECLVDCLKAFESTMKAICEKRGWTYKPTDTAKPLIDTCLKNGLVPSFLDAHLGGLRAALESGLPATRNRLAGHGAGSTPVDAPEDVASYAVHLTAANILLFAESEARSK